VNVT